MSDRTSGRQIRQYSAVCMSNDLRVHASTPGHNQEEIFALRGAAQDTAAECKARQRDVGHETKIRLRSQKREKTQSEKIWMGISLMFT